VIADGTTGGTGFPLITNADGLNVPLTAGLLAVTRMVYDVSGFCVAGIVARTEYKPALLL
jgi:hypothetical protein